MGHACRWLTAIGRARIAVVAGADGLSGAEPVGAPAAVVRPAEEAVVASGAVGHWLGLASTGSGVAHAGGVGVVVGAVVVGLVVCGVAWADDFYDSVKDKPAKERREALQIHIDEGNASKELYFHLGNAAYEAGDPAGAAVAFEQAIQAVDAIAESLRSDDEVAEVVAYVADNAARLLALHPEPVPVPAPAPAGARPLGDLTARTSWPRRPPADRIPRPGRSLDSAPGGVNAGGDRGRRRRGAGTREAARPSSRPRARAKSP